MALPVFELIMQDVSSRVNAVPALTGRVTRGEPFILPDTWPFAYLSRGSLDPDSEFATTPQRVVMDFSLTLGAAANPPANLETTLAVLVADVYKTLHADHTLGGLGHIMWLGDTEPVIGDEEGHGRQIQTTQSWQVSYTTAYGDPYTIYPT